MTKRRLLVDDVEEEPVVVAPPAASPIAGEQPEAQESVVADSQELSQLMDHMVLVNQQVMEVFRDASVRWRPPRPWHVRLWRWLTGEIGR